MRFGYNPSTSLANATPLYSVDTKWPTLMALHGFSASVYVVDAIEFMRFEVSKCETARISINQVLLQHSDLWSNTFLVIQRIPMIMQEAFRGSL